MTGCVTQAQIDAARPDLEALASARGFPSVTKAIMRLAVQLPVLPEAQRIAANEVQGCETQTWISADASGALGAFSHSKQMRGLLFALIAQQLDTTPSYDFSMMAEQLSASKKEAFERLGCAIGQIV